MPDENEVPNPTDSTIRELTIEEKKEQGFRGNLQWAAEVTQKVLQHAQGLWAARDVGSVYREIEQQVETFRDPEFGDSDIVSGGKILLTRNHSGNGYIVYVEAAEVFSLMDEDKRPLYQHGRLPPMRSKADG